MSITGISSMDDGRSDVRRSVVAGTEITVRERLSEVAIEAYSDRSSSTAGAMSSSYITYISSVAEEARRSTLAAM